MCKGHQGLVGEIGGLATEGPMERYVEFASRTFEDRGYVS